ncbi:MAG: alpha/beta fold hydrolase [Candidatus Atribacteria bacterium]|nr:alpha/beta fold hydrolase [Candidatus Atribacteria bacterium]
MKRSCLKTISVLFIFWTLKSITLGQVVNPENINIYRDGVILKGKFYFAEGQGLFPTLLLLQGFPGNQSDVIGLGAILSKSGINTMTFNFSGTHQSQGEISFKNCQLDIRAALEFLYIPEIIARFKIDTSLIVLGGYSFGGGMGMTYAMRHPRPTHIITIAGNDWGAFFEEYISNTELKNTTDANIEWAVTSGIARFEKGGRPTEIAESGIEKLDPTFFLKKNASSLKYKNILIICGLDDDTSYDFILPLYRSLKKENAQHIKIYAFQDDHSFLKTSSELATTIIKWIKAISESQK